jgi:hypothetical protein
MLKTFNSPVDALAVVAFLTESHAVAPCARDHPFRLDVSEREAQGAPAFGALRLYCLLQQLRHAAVLSREPTATIPLARCSAD